VTSDVLKRKTDGSEDEVVSYDSKKQKIDIPISEQVLMSTIPYHSLSYPEQVIGDRTATLALVTFNDLANIYWTTCRTCCIIDYYISVYQPLIVERVNSACSYVRKTKKHTVWYADYMKS